MANIYIGQINTMFGSIGLQILKLSYRNWWYFKWKADKEDRDVQPREIYITICGKNRGIMYFRYTKISNLKQNVDSGSNQRIYWNND